MNMHLILPSLGASCSLLALRSLALPAGAAAATLCAFSTNTLTSSLTASSTLELHLSSSIACASQCFYVLSACMQVR